MSHLDPNTIPVPGANSAANAFVQDVVGNKTDSVYPTTGDSLVSYVKYLENELHQLAHVAKFAGELWYVSDSGSNSNDGKTPDTPFLTITKAITEAAAGDAITIKAGTYVENVVMNKANLELWFEIGVFIEPASGVALTVSSASCRVRGTVWVTGFGGQNAVVVSGDYCEVARVLIIGGTNGFVVSGLGCELRSCKAGHQTVAGFDIQGIRGQFYNCSTVGIGATYGYLINGNVDTGVLSNCTSTGHTTSGFTIATGSQDWTIKDCSSGVGDGPRNDVDGINSWPGFTFVNTLYKTITLNGSGSYDLYTLTGNIKLIEIFGHVTTQLVGANTDVHFNLHSTIGDDPITKNVDSDMGTAVVGSLVLKNENPGKGLEVLIADQPRVEKAADPKKKGCILMAYPAQITTIQWKVGGGDDAGGVMHFHITYDQFGEDGFLEAA